MDWYDLTGWSAGAWAAVAAWLTFGVACLAALFARHQVLEARRTREDQAQPFVVVDFEPSEAWGGILDLVVKNTGNTLAKNVRITVEPPLESVFSKSDGYDIMATKIMTEGIPTLPPGREYRLLFESMPDRFKSSLPRSYEATVSFSGSRGQVIEPLVYRLDLDIYFGYQHVSIYGMHHLAKSVMAIEKQLAHWSAHFDGLRVYSVDEDARLKRAREEWEEDESAEEPRAVAGWRGLVDRLFRRPSASV